MQIKKNYSDEIIEINNTLPFPSPFHEQTSLFFSFSPIQSEKQNRNVETISEKQCIKESNG